MGFLADVVDWFGDGEHWSGPNGIPERLIEHAQMSFLCTLVAALLALPVGILLGHLGRGGTIALNVANVGRALPSFAILVIAFEFTGIGARPAAIALIALAIPPMVTNAYVGVHEVVQDMREAARGLGMTGRQLLFRVELPVASPLIMAGVRTAAVQVVATATLAALVAWGGLGRYIVDGLAQRDNVQVFGGAVLVAGLSVVTEVVLATVQRFVVPRGLTHQDGLQESLATAVSAGAADPA